VDIAGVIDQGIDVPETMQLLRKHVEKAGRRLDAEQINYEVENRECQANAVENGEADE
jgi:hypothetical protein